MSDETSYHKAVADQGLSNVDVELRPLTSIPVEEEIIVHSLHVHAGEHEAMYDDLHRQHNMLVKLPVSTQKRGIIGQTHCNG